MRRERLPAPVQTTERTPRVARRPKTAEPDAFTRFQQDLGNRALTRVLARDTATANQPKPDTDIKEKEVDRKIRETISHAPAAFAKWNGTFEWQAKWKLRLDLRAEIGQLEVVVRLHTTADPEVMQGWQDAILDKWSNNFAFGVLRDKPVDLPGGGHDEFEELYPIRIRIEWVNDASKAHYTITPNAAGATEDGRAGVGGTTSMVGWGVADTQDITHEFGHMLGCPEEYFTTNGVDYSAGGTKQGFRDAGGAIMNNPAADPVARNFDVIREEAAKLRGVNLNKTRVIPWQ
jgi:hypothetical protein